MTEKSEHSAEVKDSIQLYAQKAGIYSQNRPDYAPKAFTAFLEVSRLPRQSVAVDVGSGTGMLTRHLLTHFDTVYAVEPTLEMRRMAEEALRSQSGFHSLDGVAESIPLPEDCVDLVAVGQAIHWFQPEKSLREFQRVAKTGAWLLLAHIKSLDESFNQALESIFTEENGMLPHAQRPPSNLVPKGYYFAGGHFETLEFPYNHVETWECFLGGMASAAYSPDRGHSLYPNFVQASREVFDRFSQGDRLVWKIATEISFGFLAQ
jgi:ubiquinone/menaquinone biosynthesis C-methylase UbiE